MILAIAASADEDLNDQVLMARIANHDPDALKLLYDRYARVVYSLLRRITQHSASADDLMQEVFLRLWRNAASYQAVRSALAPWLFTLARNIAIDHLRSKGERQRQREVGMDILPSQVGAPNPEERLDQLRQARKVRDLIGSLPQSQRQALEFAYFQGMTHSEIAAAMSEPLGTVKTWIRNGLLRLRQKMEGGQ